MPTWKEMAKGLQEQQLTPWGQLLERHLQVNQPALLRELRGKGQGELESFLLVQQEAAKEQYSMMVEQGANPDQAREVVLTEMLEAVQPLGPESMQEQADDLDQEDSAGIVEGWLASRE